MPQLLHTKNGDIVFQALYSGSQSITIGELEHGGFARADGNPILDASEFDVLPQTVRVRADDWWTHRDDPRPDVDVRALVFHGNSLRYLDSGEEVDDLGAILAAFPESSPFQQAALAWFGQKHYAQTLRDMTAQHGYTQDTGVRIEPPVIENIQYETQTTTALMDQATELYTGTPEKKPRRTTADWGKKKGA